jgi:Na+/proline symporter
VSWLLAAIAAYLAAQVLIGLWIARRIHSEADYLLAGRTLGYPLLVFTVFASWFGAESVMASSARAWQSGFALTTAEPMAYGLCVVLAGALFAVPLWQRRLTTFADLFRTRYSRGVELAAAIIMIPSSLFWAAAQLKGFAHVLASVTSYDAATLVGIAAAFCALYTIFGGLLADAVTDLVQGVVIVAGILVLAIAIVMERGGVAAAVAAIDPARVRLAGGEGLTALAIVEEWAIPVFGSVVAAELVSRMIAARSPAVARNGTIIGGALYVAVGLLPVFIGLTAGSLAPVTADDEQFLPALARSLLPAAAYAVFAGALISAILSTVNTILLTSAGLVAHNIVAPAFGIASDRTRLVLARAGVGVFAAVAWLLAMRGQGIGDLVEQASAQGAGLFVVTSFGLWSTRGGPRTALVTLLGSLAVYLGGAWIGWPYPFVTSLAAAVLLYAAGAALERSPEATRS